MLLSLIKKDFLIVKKYVGIMFIVSFLIPVFMLWRIQEALEAASAVGFMLAGIFSVFMLAQYVSLKEHQYKKATTLLCATPYPRSLIVISKYCFCIIIYAGCCLIFKIETFIFPQLGAFNAETAVITFLAIVMLLSVYFPVLYKFGYETARLVYIIIIMTSPVLLTYLFKTENGISFAFLNNISAAGIIIPGIAAGAIVFSISAYVSIVIFKKRDLI